MRAADLTTVISNAPAVKEIRQGAQMRSDTAHRQAHLEGVQREEHDRESVKKSSESEFSRVESRDGGKSKGEHGNRKGKENPESRTEESETPIADGDRGRLIDLKA